MDIMEKSALMDTEEKKPFNRSGRFLKYEWLDLLEGKYVCSYCLSFPTASPYADNLSVGKGTECRRRNLRKVLNKHNHSTYHEKSEQKYKKAKVVIVGSRKAIDTKLTTPHQSNSVASTSTALSSAVTAVSTATTTTGQPTTPSPYLQLNPANQLSPVLAINLQQPQHQPPQIQQQAQIKQEHQDVTANQLQTLVNQLSPVLAINMKQPQHQPPQILQQAQIKQEHQDVTANQLQIQTVNQISPVFAIHLQQPQHQPPQILQQALSKQEHEDVTVTQLQTQVTDYVQDLYMAVDQFMELLPKVSVILKKIQNTKYKYREPRNTNY